MRGALLALPFVAVLLAGCGGGNAGGPESVAGCLREHGATVKETKVTPTFLATGIEHAQVVTFKGQNALLLYAKNGILANQALGELKQLVAELGGTASTGDLPVRRSRNVLVSWLEDAPPGGDELIDGCL